MMRPPRRPRPDPGDEDPRVVRAIEQLDRQGERFEREVIAAFERSRRELLGRIASGDEAPVTELRARMMLSLVDEQLRQLYRDLRERVGDRLVTVIEQEAARAVRDIQRLPLFASADADLLARSPELLRASINPELVRAMVGTAGDRIVAIGESLKLNIRATLTNAAINGDGLHATMKRVLAEGVTLDGLGTLPGGRPVFPSVYDRARTIAKTEFISAANTAHMAKYQAAAEIDDGILVRWSSCLCSTTCGFCRAFHSMAPRRPGEFWQHTIGSRTIRVNRPTAHPRCICRLVVVFKHDLR